MMEQRGGGRRSMEQDKGGRKEKIDRYACVIFFKKTERKWEHATTSAEGSRHA